MGGWWDAVGGGGVGGLAGGVVGDGPALIIFSAVEILFMS